jgi:hypothetical protein
MALTKQQQQRKGQIELFSGTYFAACTLGGVFGMLITSLNAVEARLELHPFASIWVDMD